MKILGYNIDFKRAVNLADQQKPKEANLRRAIPFEQNIQRIRQDIDRWRQGVKQAESVQFPNRFLLYQTYKDIVLDAHLSGAIQQRTLNVLGQKYAVYDSNGDVNEEKTKLLNAQWFKKFLQYAYESKFYGYSLIQFGDLIDDKIGRAHV